MLFSNSTQQYVRLVTKIVCKQIKTITPSFPISVCCGISSDQVLVEVVSF